MKITFYESSEYGQDVLELAALVASLMDTETARPKTEIYRILYQIKGRSEAVRMKMKQVAWNGDAYTRKGAEE